MNADTAIASLVVVSGLSWFAWTFYIRPWYRNFRETLDANKLWTLRHDPVTPKGKRTRLKTLVICPHCGQEDDAFGIVASPRPNVCTGCGAYHWPDGISTKSPVKTRV